MSYKLITASAHDTGLPAKSIHLGVTSPPYYGLRAYDGDQDVEWAPVSYKVLAGLPSIDIPAMRCGLGAEPTPEAFIGHLMLVMREMWRVLRDDGIFFVNLGDSYAGSGGAHTHDHANPGISRSADRDGVPAKYREDGGRGMEKKGEGIKPKDMMMIPSLFALAARADGWYLRSNMPWIKRNGMPDSTADRPSTVIENIFMLAKSEKYFFDVQAVKQPIAESSKGRLSQDIENQTGAPRANGGAKTNGNLKAGGSVENGRNFRSSDFFFRTWQGMLTNEAGPMAMVVNTKGYSAAHFATWPVDLVATMIKAGSSERGVCPACGASWERITEKSGESSTEKAKRLGYSEKRGSGGALVRNNLDYAGGHGSNIRESITTGWQPTCTCDASEPIPATVLDPFNGSGASGRAALQLNRSYIGIDICKSYLDDLAPARLGNVQIEMALT